ncbi:MAG: cupin domain-containing protein [Rhodocyclaceae bacterium]|nr:cupin domain-containing protein [Rhodocyclaceae bacterium]
MNPAARSTGSHCSVVELGALERWKDYTAEVASLPGMQVPGKFFLHPPLGLTGMEISVNCLPAGARVPFYHAHRRHEEVYLFIRGRGQFQVDGEVIEVGEGTVLRVAPEGERTWRNNSSEDLYYIVIQAPARGLAAPGTEDGVKIERKVSWPAPAGSGKTAP